MLENRAKQGHAEVLDLWVLPVQLGRLEPLEQRDLLEMTELLGPQVVLVKLELLVRFR